MQALQKPEAAQANLSDTLMQNSLTSNRNMLNRDRNDSGRAARGGSSDKDMKMNPDMFIDSL